MKEQHRPQAQGERNDEESQRMGQEQQNQPGQQHDSQNRTYGRQDPGTPKHAGEDLDDSNEG